MRLLSIALCHTELRVVQHSGREHRNKMESICVCMSSMDTLGYTALRCEELALFKPNGDDNARVVWAIWL